MVEKILASDFKYYLSIMRKPFLKGRVLSFARAGFGLDGRKPPSHSSLEPFFLLNTAKRWLTSRSADGHTVHENCL